MVRAADVKAAVACVEAGVTRVKRAVSRGIGPRRMRGVVDRVTVGITAKRHEQFSAGTVGAGAGKRSDFGRLPLRERRYAQDGDDSE